MSTVKHTTRQVDYRDIPGFPGYCIGSDGSAWSRWDSHGGMSNPWKPLKISIGRNGYLRTTLYADRKCFGWFIHRLVLETFIGPCPPGMEACHNDGNRLNNSLDNLRWDTHKANIEDAIRHGRTTQGERNPQAKLTNDDVREIRRLVASGRNRREISSIYGIHYNHVGYIVTRKLWASVE